MDQNMKNKLKRSATTLTAVALFGLSHNALASNPTSGKLIIINSLGVVVNGNAADSASAVRTCLHNLNKIC